MLLRCGDPAGTAMVDEQTAVVRSRKGRARAVRAAWPDAAARPRQRGRRWRQGTWDPTVSRLKEILCNSCCWDGIPFACAIEDNSTGWSLLGLTVTPGLLLSWSPPGRSDSDVYRVRVGGTAEGGGSLERRSEGWRGVASTYWRKRGAAHKCLGFSESTAGTGGGRPRRSGGFIGRVCRWGSISADRRLEKPLSSGKRRPAVWRMRTAQQRGGSARAAVVAAAIHWNALEGRAAC